MATYLSLSRSPTCALCFLRSPSGVSALKMSSALGNRNVSSFSLKPVQPVAVIRPQLHVSQAQVRFLTTQKEIDDNLKKLDEGKFDTFPDPDHLEHFKERNVQKKSSGTTLKQTDSAPHTPGLPGASVSSPLGAQKLPGSKVTSPSHSDSLHHAEYPIGDYTLPHPIWTDDQLQAVKVTHKPPKGFVDKLAFRCVKTMRGGFDLFSGFLFGQRNEKKWLTRIIFLETVAGVPGMVAAMMRHMLSLRRMQRDHGWIHTLLEEAENERMHLMTALQLKQPSLFFRMSVIVAQGVFVNLFSVCYITSPRFCHRFVGYLEEEAVKTYTKCLEDIDNGPMQHWQTQAAPDIAIRYWKLPEDATMRDTILAIRADEAHHRLVNHTLASMKKDQFNPYKPGK